ncbi:MAG: DUF2254 domain-containing protein [Actinomycetota bacterium]|nr:DUF2254 domain-containing protein [Actinomycetota bacterium]
MKLFYLREYLRSSLWFIPALCVVVVVVLALVLIRLDRTIGSNFLFEGGPEGAQTLLATISASMITFTGLVFSITMVVLQLASQQFSPRVLRTFLRDRHSQLTLGVFVATFTYSLIVLREVHSSDAPGGEFVPGLAVGVAFALVLLSLAFFVDYIHHISQSIRVGTITASIAAETREAISDIYDHEHTDEPVPLPSGVYVGTVPAPRSGVITGLDRDRLVSLAKEAGVVVEVVPGIGDFVPYGAPLLRVHGGEPASSKAQSDEFLECVGLAHERTMAQDPAFGFRQLVDIAERGLSPAVNDPTTAVQCLDEIHDLLRRIGGRAFPSGQRFDENGDLRLAFPVVSWEGYVSLAFDEIRHYGRESIQIHRRMRSILRDLESAVPPDRKPPLRRQLRLLDAAADRHLEDQADRVTAQQADEQGIGGS